MNGKLNVEVQVCTGADLSAPFKEVLALARPVREYAHQGRVFVEGKANLPFVIKIRNSEPRRLKAIVSVDGLNVISGKPATESIDQPGYVVPALGMVRVDGWRTSNQDVASFFFTPRGQSYAAETQASADGGGVIGVAFVDEKQPATVLQPVVVQPPVVVVQPYLIPPVRPYYPYPTWWMNDLTCGSSAAVGSSTVVATANYGAQTTLCSAHAADASGAPTACTSQSDQSGASAFNLGAGWGSQVSSRVTEVPFDEHTIVDVLVMYYTDAAGLSAIGVDVSKAPGVTFPAAFNGYCRPPASVKK